MAPRSESCVASSMVTLESALITPSRNSLSSLGLNVCVSCNAQLVTVSDCRYWP